MTLTKKQINVIIRNTPKEMGGTYPRIVDTLGYFTPSNANWSYRAGYTESGALVVTVYGAVQTKKA